MKKIIYIFISLSAILTLNSCKKEPLLTYNISDNIYFHFDSSIDSLNVSFAFSDNTIRESVVFIPVFVTGSPSTRDRTFLIEVDPLSSAIENTHYILPTVFIVKAGQVKDSIPLKVIRTADLQASVVNLLLNLKSGGDFKTGIQGERDLKTYKITISDMITAGPNWGTLSRYFGTFSVKKIKLLNEITGMPLDFMFTFNPATITASGAYYAVLMSRYLRDQKTSGNTVFEEDGTTEMLMGSLFQ